GFSAESSHLLRPLHCEDSAHSPHFVFPPFCYRTASLTADEWRRGSPCPEHFIAGMPSSSPPAADSRTERQPATGTLRHKFRPEARPIDRRESGYGFVLVLLGKQAQGEKEHEESEDEAEPQENSPASGAARGPYPAELHEHQRLRLSGRQQQRPVRY